MVDFIKPSELPAAPTVYDDDAIVVDNAGLVQKATPEQVVDAGAPVASQAEAIAGTDNTKRMTALRVRQVLDDETAPSVQRAQAWAEASGEPDPAIPGSRSSKSWADDAKSAASQAALNNEGVAWLDDVAALLADTALTYTAGQPGTVASGDYIRTRAEGFAYEVAAAAATDHHVTTAGGVKLKVLPIGLDYSVDAFGAAGDGVSDDATIVNAAAAAVRSAGRSYGLLFSKPAYHVSSPIDLTSIRRIQMLGEIRSSVTNDDAITIGTTSNANLDMEGADVLIFCRSTAANNGALAGSRGVVVRGAARGYFRIYSYGWDKGVDLAPIGASGIQYIAYNTFIIGGNRNHVGLSFSTAYDPGTDTGWINENTFIKCDVSPAGDALAGESVGLLMTGNYPSNKNIFLDFNGEGQDVPIWIESGNRNRILNARLESAGPVRFGATAVAADKTVEDNFVHVAYPNVATTEGLDVDWNATRPNLVCINDSSPVWFPVLNYAYSDFFKVGSAVYSNKWRNSSASDASFFQFGVLDDVARSFTPGSNHVAYVDIPVNQGDVFRIQFDFTGTQALGFQALDATRTPLAALASGQTPYIGSNATSASSGVSGTAAAWTHNNAIWRNPFFLSVNRSEVAFLRVRIIAPMVILSLLVEKLIRGGLAQDYAHHQPPIKTISSASVAPDYPGQIAFASQTLPLLGRNISAWAQIGNAYEDTAANIASALAAVNTANKFAGLVVWDSTNRRSLRARGSLATDAWDVVDGSATITPV